MKTVIDLAQAVTDQLNADKATLWTGWATVPTAAMRIRPIQDVADLEQVSLMVVPRGIVRARETRNGRLVNCQVQVAIRQQCRPADQARILKNLTQIETIADHLETTKLTNAPQWSWMSTEDDPIYNPDDLDDRNVLTAVITLTYRAMATMSE